MILSTALPSAIAPGDELYICLGPESYRVQVELAATVAEREQGLKGKTALSPELGVLFTYPAAQPVFQGFWMYQVQFPLDIAFISEDGSIVSISRMEPCESSDPKSCPGYYSEKPYKSALEVNAGFFAAAGIEVGDKVRYAVDGKCEQP